MLFYLERSGRPPLGGGIDAETQSWKAEEQGQRPGGQNKCVVFEGRKKASGAGGIGKIEWYKVISERNAGAIVKKLGL